MHNFQLVDLTGTRGIIWEHELYEEFEYFQDRPFFHSFAGDVSGAWFLIVQRVSVLTWFDYDRNA